MTFQNHAFITSEPLFPERSAKTIEMADFRCWIITITAFQKINRFLCKCQDCLTGCLIPTYVSKPKVLVSALIRTWRWRVLKVMLCLLQKFTSSDSFIRAHGWGMWKQLLFPHFHIPCAFGLPATLLTSDHITHIRQIKEQISASAPPTRNLGMIIKFITFTFESLTPIICIFALIRFDYS